MALLTDLRVRNRDNLARFEGNMTLDQRLPERSILDVFIVGAERQPDHAALTMLMTGHRLYEVYGMTEASDLIAIDPLGDEGGESVGRLLALPSVHIDAMSLDGLQVGLRDLVNQRYRGSVVDAAIDSGLSRASVCWWIRGRGKPSLGMLMQLCHRAEADVVELIRGRYVHRESSGLPVRAIDRDYNKASTSWPEIALAMKAALLEDPPPTMKGMGKRLGVNHRLLRARLATARGAPRGRRQGLQSPSQ